LNANLKINLLIGFDAGKLTIFGGLLSSGVVFATTGEIPDVVETVTKVDIPAVQDMFVGIPTF